MTDWTERGDGSLMREAPGGRTHVVEPTHDGWNLFTVPARQNRGEYRSPEFFWFDSDFEALLKIAEGCDGFLVRRDDAASLPPRKSKKDFDGHVLTASFQRGTFNASVWSKDGNKEIGRYFGSLNNCLAGHVMGRLTVQGTRNVNEDIRGRGFGNALIDIVEETTGLMAVPHGYLGTDGSLSEQARKSWQGRWTRNSLTPLDVTPDVAQRAMGMAASKSHMVMRFGTDDFACGLKIAASLGIGLTTVSTPGSRAGMGFFPKENDTAFAFATAHDGTVVSLRGLQDFEEALSHNLWLAREESTLSDCEVSYLPPDKVMELATARAVPSGFFAPRSEGEDIAASIVEREIHRPARPVLSTMRF